MAVAVFQTSVVRGDVIFTPARGGIHVRATFAVLPSGEHGFHIHKAGDIRGEGCVGACEHWSLVPANHGGPPRRGESEERHTGDLGNITGPSGVYTYFLKGVTLEDLYGRSVIVHADRDDLGRGDEPDSKTTGHSGARIACAIIGRIGCRPPVAAPTRHRTTRRRARKH